MPIKKANQELQDASLELYLSCLDLYTRNERMDVFSGKDDVYGMLTTYHTIRSDVLDVEQSLVQYKLALENLKNEIDKEE